MVDHLVKNFNELIGNAFNEVDRKARSVALTLLEEAVKASDPRIAVRRCVKLSKNRKSLAVGNATFNLEKSGRVFVVGAGKASGAMAEEIEKLLGDMISEGCVSILRGTRSMFNTERIELHESNHPIPNSDSLEATKRILSILDTAGPSDLIICLISGGGSALLCLPPDEVPLEDLETVIRSLQKLGTNINELNTVRKHLSQVKGGRLAEKAASRGCTMVTLVVSDVVGDPLDVIASGPTAPDSTRYKDAIEVLKRRNLWNDMPESARRHLLKGFNGEIPETPKNESSVFSHVHNYIIGSCRQACNAAYTKARELDLNSIVLSTMVEGEAKEVGKFIAAVARELATHGSPINKPAAVIMGGETTVTVLGTGRGGRNQELALSASKSIEGLEGVVIGSMGTDGVDGPTDAAGGIVDSHSLTNARLKGIIPLDYLSRNDSNTFFKKLGDGMIITGPTGTNVNDIMVIVAL
jgi:glycerate-2-kinase